MIDYNSIRKYFFDRAKSNEKFKFIFLFMSVLFTLFASYFTNFEYILSLIAFISYTLFWYFNQQFNSLINHAHWISYLELLHFNSDPKWIQGVLADYIPYLNSKTQFLKPYGNDYYDIPKDVNCFKQNLYRILENTFFNSYLYQRTFYLSFVGFTVFIILFILFFLSFLSNKILDENLLLNCFLIIISSSFLFEVLSYIIGYYSASVKMNNLRLELENVNLDAKQKYEYFMTMYQDIKTKAPNIPGFIYGFYGKGLNDGWQKKKESLRLSQIKNEIDPTLKVLFRLFHSKGINGVITGSVSRFLNGEGVQCNDIDVIIKQGEINDVILLLKPFETIEIKYSEMETLKSYYGKYIIGNTAVEIISEVENKIGDVWIKHREIDRKNIYTIDGIDIYFTELKFEDEVMAIIKSKNER